MEHLTYEIDINAPISTIWNTLVQSETYKVWVKAFSPKSYFDGEWIQGTEIRFLDPDMGGTKAVLEIVEPGKRLLAKHVALISKEGKESTSGEMADKWLGTTEDYVLSREGDISKLVINIKTHEDFVPMFNDAWPKAIASIKELSEKNA
ncbi:hypothetical protein [Nitrosomonas sp.]|uniref:hypothetical protein n=1 Tax=Nitrosomonas sp. TaxID=42353 RepID=UPI00208B2BAF|nr:hypothetical protein [Nitrosomonas sp.]GJL74500.1 MAG: 2-keto-3-deoxygluconate kinase [Nitrosomonas sp.]